MTLNNLLFAPELNDTSSRLYNSTATNITHLLDQMFASSSINVSYISCQIQGFRSGDGTVGTTFDAVCWIRNDSTSPPFDRVNVYHEVSQLTNNTTTLGPYAIQPDSLFVNGYNEKAMVTPIPTTLQPQVAYQEFIVNFTINNLFPSPELNNTLSSLYNSTVANISHLLDELFARSSINSTYSGCQIQGFRSGTDIKGTTVDIVCKIRNDSTSPPFDRVNAYHEVSQATKNITLLGPYILQPDSLYVNGYNEKPIVTPSPTTLQPLVVTQQFTVNMTLNNLLFAPELNDTSSHLYNSTATNITHLLDQMFASSSINASYISCQIQGFRSGDGTVGTTFDAVCWIRNDSTSPPFDRVNMYHEVSQLTNNTTTLGPYAIQPDSLFVNGYNEKAMVTPTPTTVMPTPNYSQFTINFTATNLPFVSQLNDPTSNNYKSAVANIQYLLDKTLKNTSINNIYDGCQVVNFSSENGGVWTKVDAVCKLKKDPLSHPFDRVKVYHEFSDTTKNTTTLGIYTLQNDSLYVDGYNERNQMIPPATTVMPAPNYSQFTINFTATNLPFVSQLDDQTSSNYKSAVVNIQYLLDKTLRNTSISNIYDGCQVVDFSSENGGSGTKVDAVCKLKKDPSSPPFDRVKVYHEFSATTKNTTTLGIYTLQNDSLYVDAYNERNQMIPPATTVMPAPNYSQFTINFTATNLPFVSQLDDQTSINYKSAVVNIQYLLDKTLKNTSINNIYDGCQVVDFSSENGGVWTKVDAVCKLKKDPSSPPFDRVKVYHEFGANTKNTTTLGIYTLQNDSLYVDGYNERNQMLPPPATTVMPATNYNQFTMNFTSTNLPFVSQLKDPSSSNYKSAVTNIQYLLDKTLKNTSINKIYDGCQVVDFSSENGGVWTKVDAVCKLKTDSSSPPFDRVKVYREFGANTKNSTTLGIYTLQNDSLYVDGYNERKQMLPQPTTTMAPGINYKQFTLNVTITNLMYGPQLAESTTNNYKSAAANVNNLIDNICKNSSISDTYIGCKVDGFRSAAGNSATTVDMICKVRDDSSKLPFDRVKLYRDVSQKTNSVTTMGVYSLQPDSLYVDGYNEKAPATPTPTTMPVPVYQEFTVNITLTNLAFTPQLTNVLSNTYNSAALNINNLLDTTFKGTSISTSYGGCQIDRFRQATDRSGTYVDAVCKIKNDSLSSPFDRVKVFREVSLNTDGITKLGVYNLKSNSLYVNGYNEKTLISPTTTMAPVNNGHFTLNITIINLPYVAQLKDSASTIYISAVKNINYTFNSIFKNSSISTIYDGCQIDGFVDAPGSSGTTVNADCKLKNESSSSQFDRVKVYHDLSVISKNITAFGIYTFQNDSLYVNGYNEKSPASQIPELPIVAVTNVPVQSGVLKDIRINFTLTNLYYSPDYENPSSAKYKADEANLVSLMNDLFKTSTVQNNFRGCKLQSFKRTAINKDTEGTSVNFTCTFLTDVVAKAFSEAEVYSELQAKTKGLTQLGTYDLLSTSLFVNDYQLLPSSDVFTTTMTTTVVVPSATVIGYALDFTIINKNLSSLDPDSEEYKAIVANVTAKLQDLFTSSDLKDKFLYCSVTHLRIGSVVVSCNCYFKKDAAGSNNLVQNAFAQGTNSTQLLGGYYQLKPNSVAVQEIQPVKQTEELPFWAIILIALAVLLVLVLLFLCCFLILLLLKKRMGSYKMEQSLYGTYFPHLDLRRHF